MAQIIGQGTTWNLPNYWGELFTADAVNTQFLSMIGGLTGGVQTQNDEFATSSEYDFPAAEQPDISEDQSLTAPAGTQAVREQLGNVTQIFHQAVQVSYSKLSNGNKLSGINTAGKQNNVSNELAFQINYNLTKIARDIEHTNFSGVYQKSTASNVSNRTRGMLSVCDTAGSTAIDAGGVTLTKDLMQLLFRTMFDRGSMFLIPVIWVNGFIKQNISDIYGYAPDDRNIGGVNIKQIETDFGTIGIANATRFMPASELLLSDMRVIRPVTQPVPEKGNFFYEMLAKTGASENGQIFGQYGLDHGPAFAHGKITNLATS